MDHLFSSSMLMFQALLTIFYYLSRDEYGFDVRRRLYNTLSQGVCIKKMASSQYCQSATMMSSLLSAVKNCVPETACYRLFERFVSGQNYRMGAL